jgi:hypothetical protein
MSVHHGLHHQSLSVRASTLAVIDRPALESSYRMILFVVSRAVTDSDFTFIQLIQADYFFLFQKNFCNYIGCH